MKKVNSLSKIMMKPLNAGDVKNGKAIVGSVSAASKWLKKHKQTNNGKEYEQINN
jgi:hypothetical protein